MTDTPSWLEVDPWFPVDAPLRNEPGKRERQALLEVVQQFQLARAKRYRRIPPLLDLKGAVLRNSTTFCNIFVWDFSRAMGCEIPHWVDAATKSKPAPVGHGSAELDANAVCAWLAVHGSELGWREVDADEALFRAESGFPTVAAWINPHGDGHIAVCVPALAGSGLHVAQAGGSNFVNAPIADGFGNAMKSTKFFSNE